MDRAGPGRAAHIVNVSAVQLRQRDFVATVEEAIHAGAIRRIDLEITESLIMEDIRGEHEELEAVGCSE